MIDLLPPQTNMSDRLKNIGSIILILAIMFGIHWLGFVKGKLEIVPQRDAYIRYYQCVETPLGTRDACVKHLFKTLNEIL